jgi:hypothetical protein
MNFLLIKKKEIYPRKEDAGQGSLSFSEVTKKSQSIRKNYEQNDEKNIFLAG